MYDWRIYIVLIISLCALCWLLERPLSGQIANDLEDEAERFTSCSASHPNSTNITTRDLYPVKVADDDTIKENFENYGGMSNNTSADPSSLSMGPKMSIYGSAAPVRGIGAIIKPLVSNSLSNVYVYKTDAEEEENPPEDVIMITTPTPTPLEQTISPPPMMPPVDVRVAKLDETTPEEDTDDEDLNDAPRTLGTGGLPTPSIDEINEQKAELDRLLEETITPPPLRIKPAGVDGKELPGNDMNLAKYAKLLNSSVTPPPDMDPLYLSSVTPLPFLWSSITPTPMPMMMTVTGTPEPVSSYSVKMDIENVMKLTPEPIPSVFEEPLTGFDDEPL